ncbi:amidohydrolase family protein [bacterium]|nr:amidohydrolase family protein [bacterium]MBU3954882.1 amidohydrolase family protein [bacterium]
MLIDFHAHAFPDNIAPHAIRALSKNGAIPCFHDGTISGLLCSMDEAEIEKSVILNVATKPSQTENIIKWCLKIRSGRIIPFASVHPEIRETKNIIKRIKGEGIKGIKLHPMYQDFEPDDEKMFPLYEQISDEGLIVVFHSGDDIAFPDDRRAEIGRIIKVREKFPALKIVAAHTGGWMRWEEVLEKMAGRNIYFDISMTSGYIKSHELFKDIIKKHDGDKLLFGTDAPWADQKKESDFLKGLEIDNKLREKIYHLNAEGLLDSVR